MREHVGPGSSRKSSGPELPKCTLTGAEARRVATSDLPKSYDFRAAKVYVLCVLRLCHKVETCEQELQRCTLRTAVLLKSCFRADAAKCTLRSFAYNSSMSNTLVYLEAARQSCKMLQKSTSCTTLLTRCAYVACDDNPGILGGFAYVEPGTWGRLHQKGPVEPKTGAQRCRLFGGFGAGKSDGLFDSWSTWAVFLSSTREIHPAPVRFQEALVGWSQQHWREAKCLVQEVRKQQHTQPRATRVFAPSNPPTWVWVCFSWCPSFPSFKGFQMNKRLL